MADDANDKGKQANIPGNAGAKTASDLMKEHAAPKRPAAQPPQQTNAGERS